MSADIRTFKNRRQLEMGPAAVRNTLPAIVTMTTISLKDFIITGQFGPVKIGMIKDDVINFLGKPDDDINYGNVGGALVYGWYELFYSKDTGRIDGIQNDHLMTSPSSKKKMIKSHKENIYFQNNKFLIDFWFLTPGKDITYKDVLEILKRDQISFEETDDQFKGHLIKFKSGVTMDFDVSARDYIAETENIDLNSQVLNGIRLFHHG